MSSASQGSPAARDAALWREIIDDELSRIVARSSGANTDARVQLERVLALLTEIEGTPLAAPRHLAALDEARAALEHTCAALSGAEDSHDPETLNRVLQAMTTARERSLERLVREDARAGGALEPSAQPAPPPFVASVGLPQLHHVAHDFVSPVHAVDRLEQTISDAWRQIEEQSNDGGSASDADIDDDLDGLQQALHDDSRADTVSARLRALARDSLEDVGVLGMLRRARGDEVFGESNARFEQRLLDSLDALAALAQPLPRGERGEGPPALDVVEEARRYARDSATYDPMRAFAGTFVLGCIAGTDTVEAALANLRRGHEETRSARADALALASNPAIDAALVKLAQEGDERVVSTALDALTARGRPDFGTAAVALSHPSASVRAAAARAIAAAGPREPAVTMLRELAHDDPEVTVRIHGLEGLLVLDDRTALGALRAELDRRPSEATSAEARLDDHDAELLRLLAIAGGSEDQERLRRWRRRDPRWADAVGFTGNAALSDELLAMMRGHHYDVSRFGIAAANALRRVVGAEIDEVIEYRSGRPWRVALGPLRETWQRTRETLHDSKRWRGGQPYSWQASLQDLAAAGQRGIDREGAALEIAIVSAGRCRVQPHDWIARQNAQMMAVMDLFQQPDTQRLHRPGEWLAERLGKRATIVDAIPPIHSEQSRG